jgi:hypothetical protein
LKVGIGEEIRATASVPDGYVLVGGGVEVVPFTSSAPIVAFLTGSFPDTNQQKWHARLKNYDPNACFVRVYAIGLKLKGVSKSDLSSQIVVKQATSQRSTAPQLTTSTNESQVLLGGGAMVIQKPTDQFSLAESYPINTNMSWRARSIGNPSSSTQASLIVFTIGLKDQGYIPNFGKIETYRRVSSGIGESLGTREGYNTDTLPDRPGLLITCAAGRAQNVGQGKRQLVGLFMKSPTSSGVSSLNYWGTAEGFGYCEAQCIYIKAGN